MSSAYGDITLISGNAHVELSKAISENLDQPLASARVARFTDGEVDIKLDEDIRGRDVFVLQPTCPPVNENWVELLLLLDTLRRASLHKLIEYQQAPATRSGTLPTGRVSAPH